MSDQQTADQVRDHFHHVAGGFDAIYSGNSSALMRFLNKALRWDIYQRYQETLAECGDVHGKRILDIGCGSGRYCHELAIRGADECCGIDFAENMLQLANSLAAEGGVAARCKFVLTQYLDFKPEQPFDIAIAMGYFDYISNPLTHLKKMRAETRGKVISVFPIAGTMRAAMRKVRLGVLRCPVFFFTAEQVRDLHRQAGLNCVRLERVGTLWFTVGVPA